ncbi:MAG: Bro-N domain-containing protein [Rickettsiales bacterium]|jgi:hypothetical protein|nr:Bro-N domain-containing protein [Rickettsiales bacterium]
MTQSAGIELFENKNIRTIWDDKQEKWYFSVIDVVGALSDAADPATYWRVLKHRLAKEGGQTVTNCNGLKMLAPDGKMRMTDAADTAQILRIIQSVPSPKAEPFKLWLAQIGSQRLDEIADPEIAIHRALDYYQRRGYSEGWIMQRLKSIEIRKEMTNEWDKCGVKKGLEYALLTDEITSAWTGMNTREYKKLKDLKKESLRDNMTNAELVLNMLAELSTTEIAKHEKPHGFKENLKVAKQGGAIAGDARKKLEAQTGRPVIAGRNAKGLKKIKELK